jgi:hypothetical protein
MVLLYMVTWIPSIYPLYVGITSTMDTMDPSWNNHWLFPETSDKNSLRDDGDGVRQGVAWFSARQGFIVEFVRAL